MPDHADAEAGSALDPVGEIARERPCARDQHESEVAAALADDSECVPEVRPAGKRHERLRDEEQCEEQPADLALVEEEQGRERHDRHDQGGLRDVLRFRQEAPPCVHPVQAQVPHGPHPTDPEQERRDPQIDADETPELRDVAVAEPDERHDDEDDRGADPISHHQCKLEHQEMPSDHSTRDPRSSTLGRTRTHVGGPTYEPGALAGIRGPAESTTEIRSVLTDDAAGAGRVPARFR